ncbi:sprT-like domain-containing protein Spartan isoform X2 [Odontomachus brunneus]|uniref:sprT-like domain-containing protein Spartan isoform X2 n=1 Tax=Odontomachus brunneus TaxID=486640 RepID=UPI0013F20280|nr:sprT-like domain-containing protein Spartan isoform X2 [Odontomachus brunneus]
MSSQKTKDFLMAYDIHEELNCLGVTENAIHSGKENYKPQTLIDRTLELIDPTPNIYTLFVQFNARFFWNVLCPVEVKWSNKMTSFYKKQCVIALSAPLLKLRPRKDLVETLLHEMIHAYLFLTNNNRDRDGHGPNFCKHMYRINKEAGTNITIYHNFHNEVRLYQQHWWKCNGPCQYRPPFFGMIRRAMNRAPGPSDYWWLEHKLNCSGQFIKIKEPENYKSKQKDKSNSISKNIKTDKSIANWFTKDTPTKTKPTSTSSHSKTLTYTSNKTVTQTLVQTNRNKTIGNKNNNMTNLSHIQIKKNDQDLPLDVKKLGSTSNNVHGWGISGPSEKVEKDNTRNIKNSMFSCSGILGGNNSGQSSLLTKFLHISDSKTHLSSELTKKDLSSKLSEKKLINKPVSNLNQSKNKIRKKTDSQCNTKFTSLIDKLNNSSNEKLTSPIRTFLTSLEKQTTNTDSNKRSKLDDSSDTKYVSCPVCNKMLPSADVNQHLDKCLLENDTFHKTRVPSNSHASNDNIINISSSSNSDLDNSVIESPKAQVNISESESNTKNCEQTCLVCNVQIGSEVSLNEHLDECMGAVFNDTIIIDDENDDNISPAGNNSIENKYPCPVCMQMISENLMNEHLDMCLEDKYFMH